MSAKPPCKVGDRIRLVKMPRDPCPIPVGTTGKVCMIQDARSFSRGNEFLIYVDWDIKRSLLLVWPIDTFEVITDAS